MNKKRPVNLDLGTLKFPPMAIASILHRLSGLALFVLFPAVLYLLQMSLESAQAFSELHVLLSTNLYCKLLLWAFGAAWIYHVLAGIRHLLLDVGIGEGLQAGRCSAIGLIALGVLSAILLGIWIW